MSPCPKLDGQDYITCWYIYGLCLVYSSSMLFSMNLLISITENCKYVHSVKLCIIMNISISWSHTFKGTLIITTLIFDNRKFVFSYLFHVMLFWLQFLSCTLIIKEIFTMTKIKITVLPICSHYIYYYSGKGIIYLYRRIVYC